MKLTKAEYQTADVCLAKLYIGMAKQSIDTAAVGDLVLVDCTKEETDDPNEGPYVFQFVVVGRTQRETRLATLPTEYNEVHGTKVSNRTKCVILGHADLV